MPQRSRSAKRMLLAVSAMLATCLATHATTFPWENPHARVLPQGELEWAPEPFQFRTGPVVRYIDFDAGDDSNDGTSPATAWKRHPWDPESSGLARQSSGAVTYVFKRGVTYRGRFQPGEDRGEPGNPIRLTSSPDWGSGQATIQASERVINWTRGAHPRMPEPHRIWKAEVDFLPRTLWQVRKDGKVTRLILARTPNWRESDPYDVLREWWSWENPTWWEGEGHTMMVDGRARHLGINREHLTGTAEDYVGATVWTEWGIVMGSPYPARVEAFDAEQRGVAFRGPWTFDKLERIIRNNRFYLENMPNFLDEAGEFWVERRGNGATIYLRLPDDSDPNLAHIEAGRHIHVIDATQLHHVHISGLHFRFTNIHWEYDIPRWAHPDLMTAVIRLNGPGDDIVIRNNIFEHVHQPIRIQPPDAGTRLGTLSITDNILRDTDHGGIVVDANFGDSRNRGSGHAAFRHVDLLRNKLERIGWRILSGEHGHAIDIRYPETSHLAGNFLNRIAGWGIAVFGGKPSGVDGIEIPLSRHLVHHNRVEDVLLKSNDWGGIETWQGGAFYVFNNVVHNAAGFKHWTWREGDPTNLGSFGHAYYLDAGFKNYLFNNIGTGRNNTLGTRAVNTTAIQNIYSFENWFFHNTFFRFAETVRQQAPDAGRFRYFANVFDDTSLLLFRNADPARGEAEPDPNASHFTQGGRFAYPTIAFGDNVIHNLRGRFGVFEETGAVHRTLDSMADALSRVKAQRSSIGVMASTPPLVDPAARDFRPRSTGDAIGRGVRVLVPWALHGEVGEWRFTRSEADPADILDEHWFMNAAYGNREAYRNTPRFPLKGVGISRDSYTESPFNAFGPPSALRLTGWEYLVLPHATLAAAVHNGARLPTVDMQENNFLIELLIQSPSASGTLVSKVGTNGPGYRLDLTNRRPRLSLRDAAGHFLTAVSDTPLSDGAWSHLLVEVDRTAGVRFHVNGVTATATTSGDMPSGSLANPADFLVGGGPGEIPLSGTLGYLRVARGTLEDARTTITELHRWQFQGPALFDFAGNPRTGRHAAGAIVDR